MHTKIEAAVIDQDYVLFIVGDVEFSRTCAAYSSTLSSWPTKHNSLVARCIHSWDRNTALTPGMMSVAQFFSRLFPSLLKLSI